jgi:hypothetical protein
MDEEWKYRLKDHPEQRFCTVRVSRGYTSHLMDLKTGLTLCGHTHGKNGKWVFLKEPPKGYMTCDTCYPKITIKRIKRTR